MARLFIAEKPELARAIVAGMDGNEQTCNGYIKKGNDLVTWSYGHILALKEPDEINPKYKKWNLADLPLNITFKYKPIPSSSKQLKNIIELINDSNVSEIVHCGDPDEEGQILIDEIIEYSRTTKPVKRMLINDITPKAVKKELENIKDNRNFKNISNSGFARSRADYLVGMNLTRAYSLNYQKQNADFAVFSIGRVQTPILALIVNRDIENDTFKSIDYFELNAKFNFNDENIAKIDFTLKTDEKIMQIEVAQELKDRILNSIFELKIKQESKKENPPLPYNLLNLQSEASKIYGFSAKKTLDITQALREKHKAISYNRSDCEYIPTTIYEQRNDLISALAHNFSNGRFDFSYINSNLKSLAFDDSKITAHYAIIPTETRLNLSNLNADELKIYTLIAKRFLLQFCEPREYESYKIILNSNDLIFEKTLNFTTKLGFKAFLGKSEDDEPELLNSLNGLIAERAINVAIEKKQTKPHPRYTMTTLLKDLNSVAKYVKDEKIKKLLLEKDKEKKGESGGIGTPATRADMIEKLAKQEYIEISNDKKQVITSTKKGKFFINSVSDLYKNPDITALWYEMQKDIQNGNMSIDEFIGSVQQTINDEIQKIKNGEIKMQNDKEIIHCPFCGDGVLRLIKGKNGDFFGCSNYSQGCKFSTNSVNGKPDFSPKEKPQNSSNITEYECPSCKKGRLIRRPSKNDPTKFWYGCSEWKDGCKFTCFESNGKPNFSTNS
ncbi:DNA topoisomerase 3 [Campylobacter majalis]|uniref:DNA topoisomerase n=1 Tax=Campylobacter majalis TaxID=2790656 RepID=A0ABN7KAT1_9BACT|nr:DNA topoisomerase III [Campylobacter majalis]CAD7289497.1 DNA topoisomerase 3 [Campylobacter majalis]